MYVHVGKPLGAELTRGRFRLDSTCFAWQEQNLNTKDFSDKYDASVQTRRDTVLSLQCAVHYLSQVNVGDACLDVTDNRFKTLCAFALEPDVLFMKATSAREAVRHKISSATRCTLQSEIRLLAQTAAGNSFVSGLMKQHEFYVAREEGEGDRQSLCDIAELEMPSESFKKWCEAVIEMQSATQLFRPLPLRGDGAEEDLAEGNDHAKDNDVSITVDISRCRASDGDGDALMDAGGRGGGVGSVRTDTEVAEQASNEAPAEAPVLWWWWWWWWWWW